MRAMHLLLGALAGTLLVVGDAAAAIIVPEGTRITAEPASLLGYDAALNDYISGGSSALSDANIEFLTDDFALGIDFRSDGLLRLWDNLGSGADLFNYTLQFSFSDLALPLSALSLEDTSNLLGGNVFVNIIDGDTFELALHNVQFSPGFTSADVGISVPEPDTLLLLALGLLTAALGLRREQLR
jgi:PEP-CTERM motif